LVEESAAETKDNIETERSCVKKEGEMETRREDERRGQKILQLQTLLNESNDRTSALAERLRSEDAKGKADDVRKSRALRQSELRERESRSSLLRAEAALETARGEVRRLVEEGKRREEQLRRAREGSNRSEEAREELTERSQALVEKLRASEGSRAELQEELRELRRESELEIRRLSSSARSASDDHSKLSSNRDEARAEVLDLRQQLDAARADLDVSRVDCRRSNTANANLQDALHAFQTERDAETQIREEAVASQTKAHADAHGAKLEALNQVHQKILSDLQRDHAEELRVRGETAQDLGGAMEKLHIEKSNLRKSLDEAIQQLQITQEDVVDRTLMKNVLLDWHSKKGKDRKQVLRVMASLLHFSNREIDAVGIGDAAGPLGKVVGAVAAPLPQPALRLDKIEGDNVREKWVNFLLAETARDEPADQP